MSRKIHPGRTTAHVRQLVTDGASLTGIADASGAGYSTIRSLHLGEYQTIDDQLAARIAAVTIDQCRRQRSTGRRGHNGQTSGPGDWTRHAACAGTDTELWFSDHPAIAKLNEAKAICRRCPVLNDCTTYIQAHPQDGIWAGTTPGERRRARRERSQIKAGAA